VVGYLARRLAASALLLLLVLTLTFVLVHAAPGDPFATLLENPRVPPGYRQHLEELYGLDRPLPSQYAAWLGAAVRGDWGLSLSNQRPVAQVIGEALPATALLALTALAIEYLLAVPLGLWAARRAGGAADHLIRAVSLVVFSLPVFWLALMAVLAFAYLLPIFPASSLHSPGAELLAPGARLLDLLRHLALPATVLGVAAAGGTARFVRNGLLDVLGQDYIRAARARGLSEARVMVVHALRNALAPLLQLLGVSLPVLLNGSLVIEVIFAWPGLGRVAFQAITARDYPVILATTTLTGLLVILGNLLADVLHAAADPRLRHG
jgi:peptide/nickel transport system permease protein